MNIKIGIIGLGFVGDAMRYSFLKKGYQIGHKLFCYDKYKDGGVGSFESTLNCDIIFLALPTKFSVERRLYDKSAINETCDKLMTHNYKGLVVIKSTVEPTTTEGLSKQYPDLNFVHNPEFLTAKNAKHDYHHQDYILIGKVDNCPEELLQRLVDFYKYNYGSATLRVCKSTETELMKISENSFCSVKIQFFNELYLLTKKLGVSYSTVRDLITDNGNISKNHTQVPGPDGKLSYGGYCFPKDTNALLGFMELNEVPNSVLRSTIEERNMMREDNTNIIESSDFEYEV